MRHILALCLSLLGFVATQAQAVDVTRRVGPTVQNGAMIELVEGRCTSAEHYGKPWRVWARNGEWHIESPLLTQRIFTSVEPIYWGMMGCGEV
ncbi:hypothetical protein E4T66_18100 [Sinimarinibacterium sp. CAU 1509]|uniref:hypothetical protein n=1 Tax=Sinimarinibacterium sp. CAU 1509 TaxID=2562283 RepID=UPI0010AC2E65|nr:hypothetical protein [Sinimarinibacterium sp. CAU 1509]TJY57318.1 hypothetical protein E4T66_18100 [Sinimarinibacterium sp. CAU 1509]